MGPTRYGDDVFGYVARPILKAIDTPVLYVLDLLKMEDKAHCFCVKKVDNVEVVDLGCQIRIFTLKKV